MTQPRIYSHLSNKGPCSQADGCKSRCICKKAFDKESLVCYCLESNDVLHSSIWEQLVADLVATGGCRVTSQWPESSKKSRLIYDITIDTIEVRLGGSTAYSSGRMKRTVKQLQTKGVEKNKNLYWWKWWLITLRVSAFVLSRAVSCWCFLRGIPWPAPVFARLVSVSDMLEKAGHVETYLLTPTTFQVLLAFGYTLL